MNASTKTQSLDLCASLRSTPSDDAAVVVSAGAGGGGGSGACVETFETSSNAHIQPLNGARQQPHSNVASAMQVPPPPHITARRSGIAQPQPHHVTPSLGAPSASLNIAPRAKKARPIFPAPSMPPQPPPVVFIHERIPVPAAAPAPVVPMPRSATGRVLHQQRHTARSGGAGAGAGGGGGGGGGASAGANAPARKRGTNFSESEVELLAHTWVLVSSKYDERNELQFWNAVKERLERKGICRSAESLRGKWADTQKACQKYIKAVCAVEERYGRTLETDEERAEAMLLFRDATGKCDKNGNVIPGPPFKYVDTAMYLREQERFTIRYLGISKMLASKKRALANGDAPLASAVEDGDYVDSASESAGLGKSSTEGSSSIRPVSKRQKRASDHSAAPAAATGSAGSSVIGESIAGVLREGIRHQQKASQEASTRMSDLLNNITKVFLIAQMPDGPEKTALITEFVRSDSSASNGK